MILKVIGAALVCSSSALLGLYYSRLDSFRASDLNEWKKALLILRSQIAFAAPPLEEAISAAAERVSGPASQTLMAFGHRLSNKGSADIYAVWGETLKESKASSYLKHEDWDCLLSFGKTLGFLDRSMQLASIDLTVGHIVGKLEALGAEGEKNKKMFSSLGILGGLLAVVILL